MKISVGENPLPIIIDNPFHKTVKLHDCQDGVLLEHSNNNTELFAISEEVDGFMFFYGGVYYVTKSGQLYREDGRNQKNWDDLLT